MTRLTAAEFEAISRCIYQICGLELASGKEYLVQSRLEPILAELQFESYQQLVDQLSGSRSLELASRVAEAITTKETYFFRDCDYFNALKVELENHFSMFRSRKLGSIKLHKHPFRIWSAACSTGQEPYSVAMIVEELNKLAKESREVRIIATDLSEDSLRFAKQGLYSKQDLARGIEGTSRRSFFIPHENRWRIEEAIQQKTEFSRLNLMSQSWGFSANFDLILCRNVLIYFREKDRCKITEKMHRTLNDQGVLVLGAAESLPIDCRPLFQSVSYAQYPSVVFYRKQ
jgi:chemotaxis protein methyltransferase CheR